MSDRAAACLTTKAHAPFASATTAAAAALCAALATLAGCATSTAAVAVTPSRAVGVAATATTAVAAATSAPLRWSPDHHDTLALWIDSARAAASVPGWRPQLVGLVVEAAAAWREAGAPLRFVRVADSARADVRVRWRSWQRAPGRGATTWTTNAHGELVGADVVIVLAPGPRLPPSLTCELRGIALHELGHALGLHHDPSRNAVMYWATGPMSLTDRDRAALRAASHTAAAAASALRDTTHAGS